MKKIYMLNLAFELTRRCNLACRWCARGNPQNVDITKEIINKTLDEIEPFYFCNIELTGGEPQMNPDMVLYFAKQIANRHIKTEKVTIQTNGTIKNDKVKQALIILSDYFANVKNQSWMEEIKKFNSEAEVVDAYSKATNKNILVAVSTDEHDNKDTIDGVCKFYDIGRDNCIVQKQTEHKGHINGKIGTILMEGCAVKNYMLFTKDELQNIRIIYNKYCVIKDDFIESDNIAISKTLTVSANGNVYVGNMTSYDNVDRDSMFNIMDCHNDFYDRVDKWCWQNLISSVANADIEKHLSLQWQKAHGIYVDPQEEHAFNACAERIKILADKIKECHPKFPYLKHWELSLLATCLICLKLNNTTEQAMFLLICGLLDEDTVRTIDRLKLQDIFDTLMLRNYQRKYNCQ